jgi:hypothetical protein
MEGGATVIKEIVRRPHHYHYLSLMVMILVLVSTVMIASMCFAQNREGTTIAFYKITGRLQALNLNDHWAQINDLKWDLTDNFNREGLPAEWKKDGTVEFQENQQVWVEYYVSLKMKKGEESFVGVSKMKEGKVRLITKPGDIQKLNERGGKIYKIKRLPA